MNPEYFKKSSENFRQFRQFLNMKVKEKGYLNVEMKYIICNFSFEFYCLILDFFKTDCNSEKKKSLYMFLHNNCKIFLFMRKY